jgi:hypothetical protein
MSEYFAVGVVGAVILVALVILLNVMFGDDYDT